MKTFLAIFISLIIMLMFESSIAHPKKIIYTHKVELKDLGITVQGKGTSQAAAFKATVNDCVQKKRDIDSPENNDEEVGIINYCVNKIPYM